jgi:hypothetical protein
VKVNFPTPGFCKHHGTVNLPVGAPDVMYDAISSMFHQEVNPFPVSQH